jgi:hypothetical protein
MATVNVEAVTARGIEILSEHLPTAEVTGEYHDDVSCWTWTVVQPTPTEENPDLVVSASRQFVPTDEMTEPDDEYLRLVAMEINSTFPTGATA